jgi:hypothetical protein
MLRTAVGLALLLTSLALVAQNSSSSETAKPKVPDFQLPPTGTIVVFPDSGGACPVAMHASQGVWDHTIRVRDGDKERSYQPYGQRISLNLRDTESDRILTATVRVRGWNGKHRVLSTPTDSSPRWNAMKTLKVQFVEDKDGSVSGDLWIGGFTAVDSLQLIDLTYADGRIWKPSGSAACRVQPDPLMLITDRR